MDTREQAEALGLKTFDTALPLNWYENVHDATGVWPQTVGFVWGYDRVAIWGEAVPVTDEAVALFVRYHNVEIVVMRGVDALVGHSALGDWNAPDVDCGTCGTINRMETLLAELSAKVAR